MVNIDKIIKEEIDRFFINENINTLSQFSNEIEKSLNNYAKEIGRVNTNALNNDLKTFFKNFETYCVQVIHAVNRCVNSNNLNEGLSNWGIDLPPELGGNMVYGAKKGYNKTKRLLTRRNGGHDANANANAKGIFGKNTVPSVKLSVLLNNLKNYQDSYDYKNTQYNIDNITQQPNYILKRLMPSLKAQYDYLASQTQNAQGQQP